MFVQIPIFFGFYRMLGTAIELRNSKFLWVHDLSQPDTVFHVAGFPVNILPICMAVTMIVQMSLTPKIGRQGAATDVHVYAVDFCDVLLQFRLGPGAVLDRPERLLDHAVVRDAEADGAGAVETPTAKRRNR